ncbi:MAG: DUF2218 domain-containing protein [Microvirgula sp.]
MSTSTAILTTPDASRHLFKLCKHFARKIPVEFDERHGEIRFPFGVCRLVATPAAMELHCEAGDDAELARLQDVIGSHVELVTRSTTLLSPVWQPAP